MDMQQQPCQQFCRLCRETPASNCKYNLYCAWSLIKASTLPADITGEGLSLEAECAHQICRKCYTLLGSIAKNEEELKRQNLLLTQAKDEVSSRLIAGGRFSQKASALEFQSLQGWTSRVLPLHRQLARG